MLLFQQTKLLNKKLLLLVAAGSLVFFTALLFTLHRPGYWRNSRTAGPYTQQKDVDNLNDVFNSTLGFERIYVVNLPSRTDRRDAIVLLAAVSGIKLHWVDGIRGENVVDKALPPPATHQYFKAANIGSWRGHLDALSDEPSIVENNINTALIFEDDADWDIRIKSQLRDFALASRALVQPLSGGEHLAYADPTFLDPRNSPGALKEIHINNDTIPPVNSPYGDNWDILWPGHCGVNFPDPALRDVGKDIPKGRVIQRNDPTVPEQKHLVLFPGNEEFKTVFPPHTRVFHHAMTPVCSLVYGVTQKSARRLLYEFGVKKFNAPYDLMLRDACEGIQGRVRNICVTVQPQLFNHHRPAGNGSHLSDIAVHKGEMIEQASTQMIRWSTSLNLPKLISGDTNYDEQYPDSN
ncbi:LPS glycosyltransferase, putative [Trichophyton verrucosum HKI 0517]|uniref:LPS glycosyltransferase, putative n=1 Tax=Trichophyton verrucosum (strain HKI 0517) TaxID=663202 RepID=D4DGC7_TRIVH|nr:LPS glycosyltransferase, putative [Trichophyton verrucosum HKI 0517]EFE39092.1 LPS glycosyltransferase, putative [Trichophyton verrucosum HKI 0517]